MSTGKINRYSRKEQFRILKEIESGQLDKKSAARKYGMSPSGINYWKIHFGLRPPHGKAEKARYLGEDSSSDQAQREKHLETEVERLKLKLADLYLENEFLKKAQIFAEQKRKQSTCVVTAQNLSQFVKPVR